MKILLFASLMAVSTIASAMHGGFSGAHYSGGGDRGGYHGGNNYYHGSYYGDRGGYYNDGGGVSVDWGVAPGVGYLGDPYYPYPYNEYNQTDNYNSLGY